VSRSIYVALVRHAATAWSAEGWVQGHSDPPLSPEGERQAARWRLPADLAGLHASGRLGWAASPLARAVATAMRLGATAPHLEPRLMERGYGALEGRPRAEVAARLGEDGWDCRPPGGESPREVLARVRAWLDELGSGDGPDTWLAVTHAGVIRALLAAAVGWDLREPEPLRLLPERLHRVRRRGDGHLQLVTLNEPLVPAEWVPVRR
jgi:probable phosphoglycerate mutase